MNNSPNMSYCAIENTTAALKQVYDILQDVAPVRLGEHEKKALPKLASLCVDIIMELFPNVEDLDELLNMDFREQVNKLTATVVD